MLALTICLLSQFEPFKPKPVTLDEYFAACDKAKAEFIKVERRKLIDQAPSNRVKFSQRKKIEADLKQAAKGLDKIEADPTHFIHPRIFPRIFEPGMIGVLSKDTDEPRFELSIAVTAIIEKNTILCKSTVGEFVLRGFDDSELVTGKNITIPGILIVSGRYDIGGEKLYVIEPWPHEDAFLKRVEQIKAKAKAEATKPVEEKKPSPKSSKAN